MHARHFAKISVDNAFGGGDLREISSFRLPYYYSSEDCRRIFFFIRSRNWCKSRRWTLNLTWKERGGGGEAADVIFTHKCLFLSLERSEIKIFSNGGKWRILVRNNFRIFST